MKNRKRKRDSSRSIAVENQNGETKSNVTDNNYYGTLVKSSSQKCEFCDMEFKNRYDNLIHTAKHIIIPLIKQSVHICKECLFCFSSQNDLKNHMKVKHKIATLRLSEMIEEVVKTQVKVQCENLHLWVDKLQNSPSISEVTSLRIDKKANCPSKSEVTNPRIEKKQKCSSKSDRTVKKRAIEVKSHIESEVPELIDLDDSDEDEQLPSPKDVINNKPVTNVARSILKPSSPNQNAQQQINRLSPTIPVSNDKTASTSTAVLTGPVETSGQQFLIQPAYFVPQNNPNMPNQMTYNQVFQIQSFPLMSEFGSKQLQQPFLSMIPNAVFAPPKPQEEEEEFILPDLEPSIRLVPSMQATITPSQPFSITTVQPPLNPSQQPMSKENNLTSNSDNLSSNSNNVTSNSNNLTSSSNNLTSNSNNVTTNSNNLTSSSNNLTSSSNNLTVNSNQLTSILKSIDRTEISNNVPTLFSNSKTISSILKPIERTQNYNNVPILLSLLNKPSEIRQYTEASANLINKSPLLVKQLMKSPEMVNSIKNRIVFEDEADDDVICITDVESTNNLIKTHNVTNDIIAQSNNHPSRCITIENGKIGQEIHNFMHLQNVPMTNGSSTEYLTERVIYESVHYDRLIQPGMYRCKRCPKIFPNRLEAIIHEGTTHLNIASEIKAQHCSGCDYYIHLPKVSQHSSKCNRNMQHIESMCLNCGLKFTDKLRHDRIYHSIFKCRCGAVFKSLDGLQNHDRSAACIVQSVAQLCEVCEIFVTRQFSVKYEVMSVIKQYGKKFQCSKCSSYVDEVKILKFTKKVMKRSKTEESSRGYNEKMINIYMNQKKKGKTNEKRLKSIQKRLKNITHMSKF